MIDYSIASPSRPRVALGVVMVNRLREFGDTRAANGSALLDGLAGTPGVRTIRAAAGLIPADFRLPILIDDREVRTHLLDSVARDGIGATGSSPSSIADVPQVEGVLANPDAPVAGGRHVANHSHPADACVGQGSGYSNDH